MKKVKIMLTAIAVLAVVGGALAFKAKTFGTVAIYKLNAAGTSCPLVASTFKTWDNVNPASTVYTNATTADPGSSTTPCTNTITVMSE